VICLKNIKHLSDGPNNTMMAAQICVAPYTIGNGWSV
jgi:hypothetical protein